MGEKTPMDKYEVKSGKLGTYWVMKTEKDKVDVETVLYPYEAMMKDPNVSKELKRFIKAMIKLIRGGMKNAGKTEVDVASLITGKFLGIIEVLKYIDKVKIVALEEGDPVTAIISDNIIAGFIETLVDMLNELAKISTK